MNRIKKINDINKYNNIISDYKINSFHYICEECRNQINILIVCLNSINNNANNIEIIINLNIMSIVINDNGLFKFLLQVMELIQIY